MRHYYIDYPRDFANEYTVYVVPAGEVARFRGALPDAERITRSEAIRKGWTRPRQAGRDGEQWYGGFAYRGYPANASEAIDDAEAATLEMLEHASAEAS